jgi:ribokinase
MTADNGIKTIDLLGFGITAVDDLIEMTLFPECGGKIPVASHKRQGGGLCLTALVTGARLGLSCSYAGVLGSNDLSRFVLSVFESEGVSHPENPAHPDAEPYHSFIVVDRSSGARTILFYEEKVVEPGPDDIRRDLIASSRAVLIDHGGAEGMIHACKTAREFGVPTIGDIERNREGDILGLPPLVDHLIIPMEFASEITGKNRPEEAVAVLAEHPRPCTAVTDGARGCWFTVDGPANEIHHQPAFEVEAIDTTGCGDVFHGAYAAALIWGQPVPEAIRFASAAAALKASFPGHSGIPDRQTVERFLG